MGLEDKQPQLGCREGMSGKKSKAVLSEWSLRGEWRSEPGRDMEREYLQEEEEKM